MNIDTARHVIQSLQFAVNTAKNSGLDVVDLADALRNVDAETRDELIAALGPADEVTAWP